MRHYPKFIRWGMRPLARYPSGLPSRLTASWFMFRTPRLDWCRLLTHRRSKKWRASPWGKCPNELRLWFCGEIATTKDRVAAQNTDRLKIRTMAEHTAASPEAEHIDISVPDSEVGRRARHRIARRLLPFLFVLYVIAFLDRMNIGAAALQMPHDLGFSDRVVGMGAGIFFLGYLLLEIPGALIEERWSARRWIARIMISWGLVTVLLAFIHTSRQFYLVRFFLGAAEAGFLPGVIVYLTHWFRYEDRGKAVAFFYAANPLSYVIGSPIAGLLLGISWLGMRGWRWLFILEGIPAIVFGVITIFYLTDWPKQARWLPPDERDWITEQLLREKQAKQRVRSFRIWEALRHRDVVLLTLCYFFALTGGYGVSFWLPTILKRLSGLSDFTVTLLAALPYLAGFIR